MPWMKRTTAREGGVDEGGGDRVTAEGMLKNILVPGG
jgi:hypothetical protein